MSDIIVEISDASKVYGEEVKTFALRGVNLNVRRGEFASILGPSGSGKSTLLNLLGALDRPTSGVVKIAGQSLADLDAEGLALLRQEHLGFVFQFHYLLPDFSALENVLMPYFAAKGSASAEEESEAYKVLYRVGLKGFESRKPGQLSGGQQQRVAIARALSRRPSVVLADEPTGNLDTKNSKEVFELMREFNRTEGITFLIITHDLRLAKQADRMIEIVDGQVRYDGPSAEFVEHLDEF